MGAALSSEAAHSFRGIVAVRNTAFSTARCKNALERGGWLCNNNDDQKGLTVKEIHQAIAPQVLRLLDQPDEHTNSHKQSHKSNIDVDNITFELVTEKSVDCFGDGIILKGSVSAGTCLAFFPGYCHAKIPDEASSAAVIPPWFPGSTWDENDKQINRCDGALIDGQRWVDRKIELSESSNGANIMELDISNTNNNSNIEFSNLDNSYAKGHMINHPTSQCAPNVMSWAIDFDVLELQSNHNVNRTSIPYFLSSDWYHNSDDGITVKTPLNLPVPGLVMISTKSIADGDELLFDYQLGMPKNKRPEWYHDRLASVDFKHEQQH